MVLVKKAENTSSIILLMFPTRGNEINIGHSPQALESSGNICRVFLLLIIGASQFYHDLKKNPSKTASVPRCRRCVPCHIAISSITCRKRHLLRRPAAFSSKPSPKRSEKNLRAGAW
jgi:hypothetical protein